MAALSDPNQSYSVVLDALKARKYKLVAQDPARQSVRVRAHIGENDAEGGSLILVQVAGNRVHVSASGYLVHRDGTTHRSLNTELVSLNRYLKERLRTAAAATTGVAAPKVAAASASPGVVEGPLPVAWSEPAYDPAVWGRGNFTCLPVKLTEADQAQLSLQLSNGETADVLLSLAHAPELCRSPAECKLAGGCPALGIADTERVNRLASRLSKHEVGPVATLLLRGQPVAKFDLSKHGSIAQAMAEKH